MVVASKSSLVAATHRLVRVSGNLGVIETGGAQARHLSWLSRKAAFAASSVSVMPLVRSPERGSTYVVIDLNQATSRVTSPVSSHWTRTRYS
jgi:hypothetical protein